MTKKEMRGPVDEPNEYCQYKSTVDGKYYNGIMFAPELSKTAFGDAFKKVFIKLKEEIKNDQEKTT